MSNAALLATRYARRPLLMEPNAASEILRHLAASDPRGLRSQSRLDAVLRKVGLGRGKAQAAGDSDPLADEVAVRRPKAYAPLWAQQAYGEPSHEGFAWSLFSSVAMMSIDTAIDARGEYYCGEWYHGYDTILAAQREALADPRVQGLFIRMECPGGVVTGGLAATAAFMRENRAKAGGKPIFVYADMCCSAAYYLAAQADRISAPPVGLVGSIGAVMVHISQANALQKDGLEVTSIEFPADGHKTDGASWKALSPVAKADFMAEVAQCGRAFVSDVVAGRPSFTAEALLATQARVFLAEHDDPDRSGLALGFVDAVETEEQAFAALLTALPNASAPPLPAPTLKLAASASPAVPDARLEASMKKPKEISPGNPLTEPDDGMEICETCNGAGEVAGVDCDDCDGEGQVEITDGERMASAEGRAGAQADNDTALSAEVARLSSAVTAGVDESKAIAASAEGKANPGVALAAIDSGLTLAQFKAMVTVAGSTGATAIDRRMQGAPRLGADAPVTEATFGNALLADAKDKRNTKR